MPRCLPPERVRGLRRAATALGLALTAATACGPSNATDMTCRFLGRPDQLATRPSVPDSITIEEGGALNAKLCYSRPLARGRVVFGNLVPLDTLWRTGANEPTVLHLATSAQIAGIDVEPGQYSLYSVPTAGPWTLVVNASTGQWGLTRDEYGADGVLRQSAYTDEVRRREVGRADVRTEEIPYADTLTASFESTGPSQYVLRIDWERTRLLVPLRLLPPGS